MKFLLDFENAELWGSTDTNVQVCVLVNTFNHEKYIEQCLNSIVTQNVNFSFKVIVHDDNSNDSTRDILLTFYKAYPDIFLLILERENQWEKGISNLAMLLPWIESEYVALCEGDDYWNSNDKLQVQQELLSSNRDISLSCHAVEILNEREDENYALGLRNALANFPIQDPELTLGRGNFIMTCSVMLRNNIIERSYLAGIHSLLPVDWLIFAALAEGGRINYSPNVMATYRIHESSAWSSEDPSIRLARSVQTHWYLAGGLRGSVGEEARVFLRQRTNKPRSRFRWLRKYLQSF